MEDFIFPVLLAFAVGGLGWVRWYRGLFTVNPFVSPWRLRVPLILLSIICLAGLLVVLRGLASPDVRNDALYNVLYLCLGAGWLGGSTLLFPFLGLSGREDVVERRNPAASWALGGALIGVTLCFAGANVGSGPGPGVVLFCAFLASAVFLLLWLILELIAAPSEAITVDRDGGAGMRLAGFLVASGILLGGAVAGNWESAHQTVIVFGHRGWPSLVLLVVAAFLEKVYSKRHTASGSRDWLSTGIGSLYILASAAWVAARGWA